MSEDYTWPHDIDAEQAVLGAVLISKRGLEEVTELGLEPGDFYRPAHQTIFETARDLADAGDPHDAIATNRELSKRGESPRCGGAPYLHTLTETVPSAANAGYYARAVMDLARQRAIAQAGLRISQIGCTGEGDIEELEADADEAWQEARRPRGSGESLMLGDYLPGALDELDKPLTDEDAVPAPYSDLDALLGHLRPGQLITVAGRPGMGKSTFGLDAVRCAAIRHGMPAAYFSLEMSGTELTHRVLAAESLVPLQAIISRNLNDGDWQRMAASLHRLREAPLLIDETPHVSLAHVRSRLRHMARTNPARLVVIDYLQLMQGPKSESRQQEVSEISKALKVLAKEFKVPIVLCAQLNRGPEQRTDKKPMVADLRESGSVEQDSDVVILLYRDDVYEKESPRSGEQDIIVGKHRNGPTGTVTLAYQGHYARAMDMAVG